jgi:hypothetical protein
MARTTRARARALAAASMLAVTTLLVASVGSGFGANTRFVYFGAPPDVCDPDLVTASDPLPCGGGVDPSTGAPRDGLLYFSPETVSTTTATGKLVGFRVRIQNSGSQTLTKVTLLGGAKAGLTSNPLNPPPSMRGVGPSLPAGFTYDSVYPVTGPVPACTISSSSVTSPRDGLRCDFGNIAAGTPLTILTIVMRVPASLPVGPGGVPIDPWHPRPWVELQTNEGASSSGANADTYFAVGVDGGLSVTASTVTYVESFIIPPGAGLTTEDTFTATNTDPTASRIAVPHTQDGINARINETGDPLSQVSGCGVGLPVTCFGQVSDVDVLTPVNFFGGSGQEATFGIAGTDPVTHQPVWVVEPLKLEFRWNAKQIPGRVKASNLKVVHDSTVVTTMCAANPPLPGQALPCRLPTTTYGDRDLGVTVYSTDNGSWKPGY